MLFISPRKTDAHLVDVASGVFVALGVSKWEERYSSNYPPNDHYFVGHSENAKVMIYDGDDDQTLQYPFHVSVEGFTDDEVSDILTTRASNITKALNAAGFTVFVPVGAWERIDWNGEGEVYSA